MTTASKAIVTIAIVALAAYAVCEHRVVQEYKQQIDQLCNAMPLALFAKEPRTFEGCSFAKLRGSYIIRFADYGNCSAIFERIIRNSEKGETRYVWVSDIPLDSLRSWRHDQTIRCAVE